MANTKTSLFQKLIKNPQIMKIAEQMYDSMGKEADLNFLKSNYIDKLPKDFGHVGIVDGYNTYVKDPKNYLFESYKGPVLLQESKTKGHYIPNSFDSLNAGEGITTKQLGSLALGAAKVHPFKTAGLIGLGAGNIGGLMDNNKFGGQLAGLGLGGLGALSLASGNPYMAAMLTMGGGELGALFDKLRARKELEEQQGYPNAGNPIAMMNRR